MNTILAGFMIACFAQTPGTESTLERPLTLNFSQTDVGQIFRAIGMRTGANIIFSGNDKISVSINFSARSADEAIRGTTAAAGLAYRRVGRNYIVSKPESLRQALAPFAERARIKTAAATPALAKALQDQLPEAIVSAGDGEILINGVPDDVKLAGELIEEKISISGKDPRRAMVVTLGVAPAKQIATLVQDLYPDVKITVLSEGANGGGTIALVGRQNDINEAKTKALELDAATPSIAASITSAYYDIRYSSARGLTDFLKDAMPSVQVTIAPPNMVPASLNNATNVAQGSGSSSSGSGGTGGSSTGGAGGMTGGTGSGGGGYNGGVTPPIAAGAGGSGGTGSGGQSGTSTGTQFDKSSRLVLRGRQTDLDAAIKMLESVDTPPEQVTIEVRIVDATPEMIQHTGIKYSWTPFQFFDMSKNSTVSNATTNTRPVGLGQISRLPFDLTATLDAMVSHSDAKLLASPSMQVLNNEEANFFIGDQLSYPITSSGALGATTVTIQTYNIGIGLNVRPRVNADGNITMRLNPVVESLTGISNGLPQTSSRQATTIVMVKDGESVVIGGLIRDQDQKTVQEVPILSQLPLVGQLFRHTDRDHLKSNIVVTVTPHIVKPAETKK